MYLISYHHKVKNDIKILSSQNKDLVKKAIEDKLLISPEFFGKPLQFSLKNLRSMRVGDYRVIFQIKNQEIFIIMIGHRSDIYKEIAKRE